MLFMRSLPTLGVGQLVNREDPRYYAQDDDKQFDIATLLKPQNPKFCENLAEQCSDLDVAVDLFLMPSHNQFIDVATQSHVVRNTGGDLHYYPGFNLAEYQEQLHYDISRLIVRGQA